MIEEMKPFFRDLCRHAVHLSTTPAQCLYRSLGRWINDYSDHLLLILLFFLLKMWEKAIKLSKELAETYESKVFDYEGLGNLLVSVGQSILIFSTRLLKRVLLKRFLS